MWITCLLLYYAVHYLRFVRIKCTIVHNTSTLQCIIPTLQPVPVYIKILAMPSTIKLHGTIQYIVPCSQQYRTSLFHKKEMLLIFNFRQLKSSFRFLLTVFLRIRFFQYRILTFISTSRLLHFVVHFLAGL